MSDETVLAILLFSITGAFIVSSIGIAFRHAVPKAPRVFQVTTVLPGVGVAASAFMVGVALLGGSDTVIPWAIALFAALSLREWALNAYALYNSWRELRESRSHAEDISRRMGDAEIREEDEFSERQQEQGDVRERLEAAELVSRQELAEMESRIYAKLEGILEAVRESKDRRGE